MANISATPETSSGLPVSPTFAPEPAPAAGPQATPSEADLRLVIEEDEASGSYVYKTIDRRTGEVVAQLPRDEMLRRGGEGDYAAGDVIRARA